MHFTRRQFVRRASGLFVGAVVLGGVRVGQARAAGTHTVVAGDTLSGIAAMYGFSSWQPIYAANRDLISNPNVLSIGWVLTIPDVDTSAPALEPEPVAAPAPPAHGGGLRDYLYRTGPDPEWQDAIIYRESRWDPSAKNPRSTASGLAQFLDSTWAWGENRFGIWGSPFNGYLNIDMMNAFLRAGEYYHWNCNGQC